MLRAAVKRELRRAKLFNSGDGLSAAWAVGLVSLKVNEVDVVDRETGKGFVRTARRITGGAPTVLALTPTHLLLRTPAHRYAGIAALTLIARSVGPLVELAFIIERPAKGTPAASLIPDTDMPLGQGALVTTQLDCRDGDLSAHIVRHILDQCADALRLLDPESRATCERLTERLAGLPLD